MPSQNRYRLSSKKRHHAKVTYQPNYSLLIVVILMLLFGLLMIFSASAVIAFIYEGGDTFYFFKRQILWIIIGAFLGFILYRFPVYKFRRLSFWMLIVTIFLMLYLVPEALFNVDMPFVDTINGATRWINIGITTIQPSEIAKLTMVLFAASWFTMSEKKKMQIESYIKKQKDAPLWQSILTLGYKTFPFIMLGIVIALVLIQKDLDTVVIITLIFLSIFYLSGQGKKHTFVTMFLLTSAAIMGFIATIVTTYRLSRFQSFLQILFYGEPSNTFKRGESFQVWNGLIALGLGGIFGVGYGQSRQKLFFLQEAAYTDSIFTIVGEEFGLLGTLAVILGFLIILSIGLKIAKEAPNKFQFLLAAGITSWIAIQAFLNIAANLALIPFGGMPLPFLTYGGSNTIMILLGVGILLNISKKRKSESRI